MTEAEETAYEIPLQIIREIETRTDALKLATVMMTEDDDPDFRDELAAAIWDRATRLQH